MRTWLWMSRFPSEAVAGVVFTTGLLVFAAFWALTGFALLPTPVWVAAGLLSLAAAIGAYYAARASALQLAALQQYEEAVLWLQTMMDINRIMLESDDESAMITTVLEKTALLARANIVTYVPVDELGQPVASYLYPQSSAPESSLIKTWAEQLTLHSIQERCSGCQRKEADAHSDCPMLQPPFFANHRLQCIALRNGGHVLGVAHLHLQPETTLPAWQFNLLSGMLSQLSGAVQAIRLRNQERNTLRQLQMSRSKADLTNQAGQLLKDAAETLQADYLAVRADGPEPVLIEHGEPGVGATTMDAEIATLPRHESGQLVLPDDHGILAWVTFSTNRRGNGALLCWRNSEAFTDRETNLLKVTAGQLAWLLDSERLLLEVEYDAVIQERIRLAREIHDGLAQTLAYLKMQVSQMQNYLTGGNVQRLSQSLDQNHQVLSQAYLDVRQAIDNLRQSPEISFPDWLIQASQAFESACACQVETDLRLPASPIAPEIQAQLMRVIQEALNNARKHAQASRVRLAIYEWQGELILEVADNGRGFNPEDVPEDTRHGMRGMRERADFIGADFQVISQPNQGTTIRLRLPNVQETLV